MVSKIRTFMLSLLAYQFMARAGEFLGRYPSCWLVWEPGAWSPPANSDHAQATRLPATKPAQPCSGDALCFELQLRPGQKQLRVGRAAENDLVINDATVSREHLVLHWSDAGWAAEALQDAKNSVLDGRPLAPGAPAPLRSGTRIELGQVQLTFHEPGGFQARVSAAAARLRA